MIIDDVALLVDHQKIYQLRITDFLLFTVILLRSCNFFIFPLLLENQKNSGYKVASNLGELFLVLLILYRNVIDSSEIFLGGTQNFELVLLVEGTVQIKKDLVIRLLVQIFVVICSYFFEFLL